MLYYYYLRGGAHYAAAASLCMYQLTEASTLLPLTNTKLQGYSLQTTWDHIILDPVVGPSAVFEATPTAQAPCMVWQYYLLSLEVLSAALT